MMEKNAASRSTNRDKIVYAAIECFIRKGFHQTSVRDIAQTAGVSQGNLYNHFKGKAELITEIARIERDSVDSVLSAADGLPPLDGLRAIGLAYIRNAATPADAALTLEISAEAVRNPEIAAAFMATRTHLRAGLLELILAGQQDDSVKADLPAQETVSLLLDLWDGQAVRSGLYCQPLSQAEVTLLNHAMTQILAP
jgi:AcrR family transcriptional regulator